MTVIAQYQLVTIISLGLLHTCALRELAARFDTFTTTKKQLLLTVHLSTYTQIRTNKSYANSFILYDVLYKLQGS